ncbi:MAG TPA: nuclear transport factor 2 family protein [Longimicrobiales bacterium]|nr:nuclear transport factor 2 family protein [Longimicrobiales bacterium]
MRPLLGARALALLVAGWAAAACVEPAADARIAQNELLARSLLDALARADTAAIEELFWPDAVYDDYQAQLRYLGIQEIVGYVTSVHVWGDNVYVDVAAVHAGPESATAEWLLAAVQARPMGDLVPVVTNREVVLNGVTVIEVEGGRIRRAADYVDTAPIALQLGGRIEMPGGGVRELAPPR